MRLRNVLLSFLPLFLFVGAAPAFACAPGEIDVLDYIVPIQDGKGNHMDNGELFRTYTDTVEGKSGFYIMKSAGSPKWFESHNYDGNYIYLINDTTWATGEGAVTCNDSSQSNYGHEASAAYYNNSNQLGGPRFPRCMAVGTTYSVSGRIMGLSKSDCKLCNTAYSGSYTFHKRITHQGGTTLYHTGVTLADVIIISEPETGEEFIFDKTYGWVGWSGPSGQSAYWDGTRTTGPGPAELPCDEIPPNMSTSCELRDGPKYESEEKAVHHKALKEKVQAKCEGNFFEKTWCKIVQTLISFLNPASYWYSSSTVGLPTVLRLHQQLLREATDATSTAYAGIIARGLSPSVKFAYRGIDIMKNFIEAESQKVKGTIISNEGKKQGDVIFDTGSGNYGVLKEGIGAYLVKKVKFPHIPALLDKGRELAQMFVPRASLAPVPTIQCSPTGATSIEIPSNTRDVELNAYTEGGQQVACEPEDPDDPDCNMPLPHPSLGFDINQFCQMNPGAVLDTPGDAPNCGYGGCGPKDSVVCNYFGGGYYCAYNEAECGDDDCPCEGKKDVYVEMQLWNDTKVSYTQDAADSLIAPAETDATGKLTKTGGALTIWSPVGGNFIQDKDLTESRADFTYDPKRLAKNVETDSILPVADLGGVAGGYSCIVDQMLDTPYNAAQGVCEEWMENLPQDRAAEAAAVKDNRLTFSRGDVLGEGAIGGGSFWTRFGAAVGKILNKLISF